MSAVLEGHSAIVTGAASGIGRAIARRFAAEGAFVLLVDVVEKPAGGGRPTLDLIEESGGKVAFLAGDIADPETAVRAVDAVVERTTRLDVIVNNAAIGPSGRLTETTRFDWDRTLSVNLTGVFYGCRAAVRQMLAQEPRKEIRGRIVNISSQHGMVAAPGHLAYGVTKAGVVYMTRQIAADYAAEGIVCNAVAPGKILSGGADSAATGMGGNIASEDELAYSRSRTPWPRFGQPDDVASAALFLASPQATFITGENLMVDGGWMAG